jgi:hypothetical protein
MSKPALLRFSCILLPLLQPNLTRLAYYYLLSIPKLLSCYIDIPSILYI